MMRKSVPLGTSFNRRGTAPNSLNRIKISRGGIRR